MNTKKVMKLTCGVILSVLLLFSIVGGVSAVSNFSVGNLSINLTNGEITDTGVNYTGYIEFTPSSSFQLNAFRVVVVSDDPQVTLMKSSVTDGLFANYTAFEYLPLSNKTKYSDTASLSYLSGVNYVQLLGNTTYKIDVFTIHVNTNSQVNPTVNLSFNTSSGNQCYVCSYLSAQNSPVYKLNNGLTGQTYMLNNSTANSVSILKPVNVTIETNGTTFDKNVSVFSELTKKMVNYTDGYFLNYSSANENIITFYNYSVNASPKFVVLQGSSTAVITVNLTNKTSGKVLDTKTFSVETKAINLTASCFNYTANHTYTYTGKSIAATVAADVRKALLNHSIGAADSTDNASIYGYARVPGAITLTFFNDSKCQHQVTPIDGGTYYFNVSVAANANYTAVTNLTISNNSFVINGATIFGVPKILNISYFNATTPAKVTIEFNATGMDLNLSVFNLTTVVPKYTYWQNSYNLSFKQVRNFTSGYNYTIAQDNSSITFNASTSPIENVTYFDFVGCPRGDVSMDGEVLANDASILSTYYANQTRVVLTKEQLFYGCVSGQPYVELIDIRQIAQYAGGILTPDYKSI